MRRSVTAGRRCAARAPIGAVNVLSGSHVGALPPFSLGFVYAPALLAIVAASTFTAPIGARAAHRLPAVTLRRIYAGLLYTLATKMLWTYV